MSGRGPAVGLAAAGAVATAIALAAQPLARLKGKVVTEAGAALEADVRIEAIAGPRGEGYVGQRAYVVHSSARANDQGSARSHDRPGRAELPHRGDRRLEPHGHLRPLTGRRA